MMRAIGAAFKRIARLTSKERNNREVWLNAAVHELRPALKAAGAPLHARVRVAVGFPLGGFEKIAGQCFKREVSKDRHNEIFISPLVDDAPAALATLVHELLHAADNGADGHGKGFTAKARALDLEGKATATKGGAAFKRRFAETLRYLGKYPHAALRPTKVKRQGTRLIKVECPDCGYVARVTSKWIDAAGAPICPVDECPMEADAGE